MQTMHLFAGGGGGLLSDLILGHNPIIAVEWEPYACQILRERAADGWFPDLQVWEGDVRLFNPSEYAGRVGLIHAGFPCQDLSCAGKQAGLGEGTRSGLYREVLRIAGIVKPRYLFLENVSAIVNLGLGTVVADLSSMGYGCRWLTLRASDVGAPHHRDRWWGLATHTRYTMPRQHESNVRQKCEVNERTEYCNIRKNFPYTSGIGQHGQRQLARPSEQHDDVADTESRQSGQQTEWQRRQDSCGRISEIPDITIYGRREIESEICGMANGMATQSHANQTLQGWWEKEPEVGRVTTGCQHRAAQLKALGNGQVSIQAAVAFSILIK